VLVLREQLEVLRRGDVGVRSKWRMLSCRAATSRLALHSGAAPEEPDRCLHSGWVDPKRSVRQHGELAVLQGA
jgi:hypothetical protein